MVVRITLYVRMPVQSCMYVHEYTYSRCIYVHLHIPDIYTAILAYTYVYIIAGIFVLVSADDAGSATGVSFAVALCLGMVNG